MVGIHVPQFDDSLERIARLGGEPLTEPLCEPAGRRVCLYDPDGILLELMEDSVLAAADAAGDRIDSQQRNLPSIASVTVAVRDLDRVRTFWVDVLGLEELLPTVVHQPYHEALWGLQNSRRECAVLRAGEVALEFVRYLEPVGRPRPAGYMISDQGVLNIALGTTSRERFADVYERAVSRGFRGHAEPWTLPGVATVVYLTDPQGLSVELLHVEPGALERMGFRATEHAETPASPAEARRA
jgi:catechol 2,3-dioxygenase-like lactoylglutathione lyase family enzyme